MPRHSRPAAGATGEGAAPPVTAGAPTMELVTGAVAAGGGCVARAPDGRVVFVRHSLPGERVVARVTSVSRSFLRADAVRVLVPSADRVEPPCPHAGPGRCGGCDWQHVAIPTQRSLKERLVAEQLRRVAGLDREVTVHEVPGAPHGLGWRTRVRYAATGDGALGFHRHRSHEIEPVESCLLATAAVSRTASAGRWRGARQVEVTAAPGDGAVVDVAAARPAAVGPFPAGVGVVVNGRPRRRPDRVEFTGGADRYQVSPGVFWQVHMAAADVLVRTVLDALGARPGERAADLYAGAGLFTVPLARAVGRRGSVIAVERSRRACADAAVNAEGLHQVELVRATVTPELVSGGLGHPDLVVLDPARPGAGRAVMEAIVASTPPARRVVYVACDPASFARDLAVALRAGWALAVLEGFDLFPMTEHVELVAALIPPGRPG